MRRRSCAPSTRPRPACAASGRRSTTRATTRRTASTRRRRPTPPPRRSSDAVVELARRVAGYDHVLLDLDGCVWVGDEPTPDAVEAVAALRAAGVGLAFVTNDGRYAEEDVVRKLWRLGFQAAKEEVVTVGGAVQYVCAGADWRAGGADCGPAVPPPRGGRGPGRHNGGPPPAAPGAGGGGGPPGRRAAGPRRGAPPPP